MQSKPDNSLGVHVSVSLIKPQQARVRLSEGDKLSPVLLFLCPAQVVECHEDWVKHLVIHPFDLPAPIKIVRLFLSGYEAAVYVNSATASLLE